MIAALTSFVCQSSRGDLDHMRLRFDDLKRYEVVASADDCLKRRCNYYTGCLLHGARRVAAGADIVLTNQALLFCDITAEGSILPDIRHWVIDEAHGAEDEARDQLSFSISGRELSANLDALLSRRGILNSLKEAALPLAGALSLSTQIDEALTEAAAAPSICSSFMNDIKGLVELAEYSSYDQVDLWVNAKVRASGQWASLFSTGASLSRRLARLFEDCRSIYSLANQFDELIELQADLAGQTSELGSYIAALDLILNGDDPAFVYSAQLDRRPEQQTDSLSAAMIDVGEVLATGLYPETLSVIYTSATLATGESFEYFARASGLAYLSTEQWRSLQLASSYDFDNQMAIYLPTDLPEPNQPGYRDALEELLFLVHTAIGGSVLTLFTNRREMEELYGRLRDRLADNGIQLRCQWRGYGTRRLSEEFLANRELSLFALRSFWHGFDAPGDTLRCVVIPKLPFGRPTDPLSCERMQRERDAWKNYALPEAIIDLRQAAGRLIRSSTDRGALVLADSRLLTKWYGQAFLNAMPSRQRYTLDTTAIAEALSLSSL
jgi:ATP-dependent DNA helicase DinG